jgi:hypothetical protein
MSEDRVRPFFKARPAAREGLLQILCRYDYDGVCAIDMPYRSTFEGVLHFIMPGLDAPTGRGLMVGYAGTMRPTRPQRGFFLTNLPCLPRSLDQ